MLLIDHHEVDNGHGYRLSLRRTRDDQATARGAPLLIIPGYGMNSFIFGFHPRGTSLEGYLAGRGFEVWSVDLRGQARAVRTGGDRRYGLADLALVDLPVAVDAVLAKSTTGAAVVDLIGCSLGASLMFGYVACRRGAQRAGRLVSVGGPVRWERVHPALSLAFASPTLVGLIPFPRTRRLAAAAMPLLARVPWLLSPYLHPGIVDLGHAASLAQTVEDPNRHVNREIAEWIRRRDLVLAGQNVCELLRDVANPLLTVIANADGIVPRETALWPHGAVGSPSKTVLEVGDASLPIAHADMFVSDPAPRLVFAPLADWLDRAPAGGP
jgi:pimeloyl-ACP methyl ester carboxylesterase